MRAFEAFRTDVHQRLGRARRHRNTQARRYVSRHLNQARANLETSPDLATRIDTLRRIFLAELPTGAENGLEEIRRLNLTGTVLITRLEACANASASTHPTTPPPATPPNPKSSASSAPTASPNPRRQNSHSTAWLPRRHRHPGPASPPIPTDARGRRVDTFGRKVDTSAKNWTHCPRNWTHPAQKWTHWPARVDTSRPRAHRRKLNTSAAKLNTLTPKLNTFGQKLNTSPPPTEHIPVIPLSSRLCGPGCVQPGTQHPDQSQRTLLPRLPTPSSPLPPLHSLLTSLSSLLPQPLALRKRFVYTQTTLSHVQPPEPPCPPASAACPPPRPPGVPAYSSPCPGAGLRPPLPVSLLSLAPLPFHPHLPSQPQPSSPTHQKSAQTVSRRPAPLRGAGRRETVPPSPPPTTLPPTPRPIAPRPQSCARTCPIVCGRS